MDPGFSAFLWSKQQLITRVQPFIVTMPAVATRTIDIGKEFPRNVSWIYGISVKAVGVGPDGETLIDSFDSENLFITLKIGSNSYFKGYPLENFVYWPTSGGIDSRDFRYWPCKIPGNTDVDISTISNPTGIVNKVIMFNFHYV